MLLATPLRQQPRRQQLECPTVRPLQLREREASFTVSAASDGGCGDGDDDDASDAKCLAALSPHAR